MRRSGRAHYTYATTDPIVTAIAAAAAAVTFGVGNAVGVGPLS